MNFLPLCTAIVCPTISGTTVERRDQVLMTFLSPPRFMISTFSSSGTSTKGPFFSDLDIISYQLPASSLQFPVSSRFRGGTGNWLLATGTLFLPPLYDEAIGRLPIAGLVTLGRLAPRRYRVPAASALAFTAAERVVDGVHRDAAHVRPLAHPPAPAGLADRDVLVVDVADLADRGEALDVDLADLARRHLHRGVVAFLGDELHRRPGAARNLSALARLQFHVVELRAEGDVLDRPRL